MNIIKEMFNVNTITNKGSEIPPVIVDSNERTMLPIRFVAEALGAKVEWNEKNKQVTITKQ